MCVETIKKAVENREFDISFYGGFACSCNVTKKVIEKLESNNFVILCEAHYDDYNIVGDAIDTRNYHISW